MRWVVVALALAATACTTPHGDLALAVPQHSSRLVVAEHDVQGRDCTLRWLGGMLGPAPKLDAAIAAALASVPDADALADLEITYEIATALLVGRYCVHVEGDAVRTRRGR
jgi:hypothetical protein